MGWGSGTLSDGREAGYLVRDVCKLDGCKTKIDRGLSYVCGSMHEGGEHGCGDYFCDKHLFYGAPEQLCDACYKRWEKGEDDD